LNRYVANDPFPPVLYTRLTYVDQGSVGSPGDSTMHFGGENVYNLNSVYDPYVAGGVNNHNTTALGLTEIGNLYYRYKVHQVEIKVTFYHPHVNTITESNETTGLYAGIIVNNPSLLASTLAGNDFGRVSKLPSVWTKVVPAAGPGKCEFRQKFDLHTLFELTKLQYETDINNTTAGVGANPSTLCQMAVALADSNGGASACYTQYRVEITYLTQFYQRKALSI